MGSYTFRWPAKADEVFVTGTFDDWGKTIRLDQKDDIFEKEVHFPRTGEKVHFKFVVDGIWTTDNQLPEEDDGSSNVNNVLYPDQIQTDSVTALQPNIEGMSALSGVTPNSTTAGLAGGVPTESSRTAAPGSTTAGLDKDVPLEQRANVPGGFPAESPYSEYSVNPIPASSGIGNPIQLKPGEKVPDSSTFNSNTVQSTARTDKAAYDQVGSSQSDGAFSVPPVLNTMIPESSLPMGDAVNPGSTDPGYTIQSAAPASTTAGLAAGVPLESQKKHPTGTGPVDDVPNVVRESMSKAHKDPEAAANEEVVEEKRELEHELQQKVRVDNSTGTPAPTATATTTETAPKATGTEPASTAFGAAAAAPKAVNDQPSPAQLSPRTTTPTGTSGAGAAQADTTTPTNNSKTTKLDSAESAAGSAGKGEKKKKRLSFFGKLKEKLK
ncbi:hypothetical protein BDW59DRAFT_160573 [Aspergillus cavernicola]|uniref:AMP-activated protein kinase glycogen-binding domain-containing protein n=1 Tax=Aspergillus cavernicola TaxID=176166 RepID=A0ABR4IJL8_9EURO